MIQNQSSNYLKHTSKNPIQKLLINNFYQVLIELVKPLSIQTILDVGCGEGFTLNRLTKENIGKSLEGIDNSEESIHLGKRLFPKLKLCLGNISHLPYKNNSFDLVFLTEVLEHLDEPENGLREVLRVSNKYVVCSVPNEPFFMLANFLRGKNLIRWGNDPGHINHWTIFSFRKFIEKQNIKIKMTKLPFPWIMMLLEK